MAHSTARRRLLTLLALAVVPWTVVFIGSELTLFFPFGVLNTNPLELVDVYSWFAGGGRLPRSPDLLPLSYVFYTLALASVAAGLLGREPRRLTAGLLVLAGVSHLGVSYSVLHRLRYTPVPVGALLLVAAAWWFYWPDLRSVLFAPGGDAEERS
jgi:uncharacterized protein (TIGR04206 family)